MTDTPQWSPKPELLGASGQHEPKPALQTHPPATCGFGTWNSQTVEGCPHPYRPLLAIGPALSAVEGVGELGTNLGALKV